MTTLEGIRGRVSRSSPRARALGLFFVSSLFSRGVGAVCQVIQVPIVLGAVGAEAFGLWISLMSISFLITFADFGLGQGMQNKLAEAFATGRAAEQRRLFWGAFAVLCALAVVVFAVAGPCAALVDVPSLFHLRGGDVRAAAPAAVRVVLAFLCANFPLGLAQRVAYARQRGWMHNLAQACSGVAGLAAIAAAARAGWGLVGIVAVSQSAVVLGNLALLLVQLRQLGWLGQRPARVDAGTIRELFGLGGFFALQQVLVVVLFALPQVVISTALGAASVTAYNLAQRFFNVFAIVQSAFMVPLWPAYSDAVARAEHAWIRRALVRSLLATVFFTVLPMGLATLAAPRLIALWVGSRASLPSGGLVWLLFAWNAVVFLQQPFGYLLSGVSEVHRMTVFAVVGTVASAALMELLVRRLGQDGVVIGLLAGFVPFYFLAAVHQALRVVRSQFNRPGADPGAQLAREAC